jgi:hypothetical protein
MHLLLGGYQQPRVKMTMWGLYHRRTDSAENQLLQDIEGENQARHTQYATMSLSRPIFQLCYCGTTGDKLEILDGDPIIF